MTDEELIPIEQRLKAFFELHITEQETYLIANPTDALEFILYLAGYCKMQKILGVKRKNV